MLPCAKCSVSQKPKAPKLSEVGSLGKAKSN